MKAFTTKYALTGGIEEVDGEVFNGGRSFRVERGHTSFYHGKEWHYDFMSAKARAESMRAEKIKRLREQITKLEQLSF